MRILFAFIVLGLLLVACTPQTKVADDAQKDLEQLKEDFNKQLEGAREQQENLTEPEDEVEVDDIKVEEKEKKEQNLDDSWKQTLLASLGEIINKAEEKSAKGYTFIYTESDAVTDYAKYYVKGDKIRVDVYDKKWLPAKYADMEMNVVYIDRAAGTATAYCLLGLADSPHDCGDAAGEENEVDGEDFLITLPYEILSTIDKATERGPMKVGNRNALAADVEFVDGDTGVIWLDQYSGLPLKMEKAGKMYYYNSMTIGVPDDQVVK